MYFINCYGDANSNGIMHFYDFVGGVLPAADILIPGSFSMHFSGSPDARIDAGWVGTSSGNAIVTKFFGASNAMFSANAVFTLNETY